MRCAMSTAAPPQPIVRSCTTAADIRAQGLEPIMDIIAACDMRRDLLTEATSSAELIASLAGLLKVIEDRARVAAAFVDLAHRRLQHAEHNGDFNAVPEVDSESGSGRALAARIAPLVVTLAQSRDRAEVQLARQALHAIFAEHGLSLLERRVTDRMRPGTTLALRGELNRWAAAERKA